MNEDTEKKIKKALKERDYIKFDEFTRLMEIIVYFSEDMGFISNQGRDKRLLHALQGTGQPKCT